MTTDKASKDDGIPAELFQTLKDDAVKVLHLVCQQIWKTQQWPQDWKTSIFIPIPKDGSAKEWVKLPDKKVTQNLKRGQIWNKKQIKNSNLLFLLRKRCIKCL